MYRPFLALRYLLSRPINLLGVLGVTLGVWALIVVVSIFSGFLAVIGEHLRSASADVTVRYLPPDTPFERLERVLDADPEVLGVAPRLVHFALLHRPGQRPPPPPVLGRGALQGGDGPFVFLIGVDPARERDTTGFRGWLEAVGQDLRVADLDRPLGRQDGLPTLLLGEERMRSAGLRPGDRVVLSTGRTVRTDEGKWRIERIDDTDPDTGEPQVPTFVVAGAYRTRHIGYDGNNALVHIDELRQLLRLGPDVVREVAVRVPPGVDLDEAAGRVQRAVRRELGFENSSPMVGPIAVSWRVWHGGFLEGVEWQRALMKIILIVIMIVAAVLMYATLSMMVAEKTSDIGILTALGGSPRGVMTVFLACGLAITLTGIALGTITGCLSAIWLDDFRVLVRGLTGVDLFPVKVYNLDRVPHELDPWWILQVAGVAVTVGVLVSALPALRAARHDPLISLRGS
ncbi:MAG: ABC transporter permease [Planctomycetota bacterium]